MKYVQHLRDAPVEVINLAREAHLELCKTHAHHMDFITGEEQALYDGTNGIIVWTSKRNGKMWWVEFAYVAPGERRTGLYTQLRQAMHALAKKQQVECIESLVSIGNEAVHADFAKHGQVPANLHYRTFL
jgi:hypothetical protein